MVTLMCVRLESVYHLLNLCETVWRSTVSLRLDPLRLNNMFDLGTTYTTQFERFFPDSPV